jgi:hypothetical protein
MRLTLQDAIDILDYASEGRTVSTKPDLLANEMNRRIARVIDAERNEAREKALRELCYRLEQKSFPLTPHDTAEACITMCDLQEVCKELALLDAPAEASVAPTPADPPSRALAIKQAFVLATKSRVLDAMHGLAGIPPFALEIGDEILALLSKSDTDALAEHDRQVASATRGEALQEVAEHADEIAEAIHNCNYDPDVETFDVEGAARTIKETILALDPSAVKGAEEQR